MNVQEPSGTSVETSLLTENFQPLPFWWDKSPLVDRSEAEIPASCDVAVIGSGYTGLCAALELAENGRQVVVLDSGNPGHGCSTRNGGQISSSIKPGFSRLSKRYGAELAAAIINTGHNGLFWIEDFIRKHGIDCDFERCGRFYGAHTQRVFKSLGKKLDDQPPGISLNAEVIPQSEQHRYIDSECYHGGLLYKDHCSLDPGRYHQGLLKRAEALGVTVIGNAKVTAITPVDDSVMGGYASASNEFRLQTSHGELKARNTIVATNGYSDSLMPWTRRRIIPIGSYMIATEELPQLTIDRLIPEGRIITDSRKLVVYYRPCPARRRILFGARVSITETDPVKLVPAMHKELCARFPELGTVKISHAWMGFVAYTFDDMPHFGVHDGVHYAMGYCGSGVSLSSYSGVSVARQVMGLEADDAFSRTDFEQRFFYREKPWFLGPSIAWYRFQDRFLS